DADLGAGRRGRRRAGDLRRGGQVDAEREAAAGGHAGDQEGTAVHEGRGRRGDVVHGRLPHALAAAVWIASRTCWKVPHRQMLVIASLMSASLGLGLSLSSAATAMIMPDWQ